MNKLNGHSNGDDDGKVTSIEAARRRAAEKAKAVKRAAHAAGSEPATGSRGVRDWIVGGLIVAMAIGYVASVFFGAPQVTREGVQ